MIGGSDSSVKRGPSADGEPLVSGSGSSSAVDGVAGGLGSLTSAVPCVIGVKAVDERSGLLVRRGLWLGVLGAGGGQVGDKILVLLPAAPGQDGERVAVERLGEQVEGGGKVLARDGIIGAGAVQRQLPARWRGASDRPSPAKTSSMSSGISPDSSLAVYQEFSARPRSTWG